MAVGAGDDGPRPDEFDDRLIGLPEEDDDDVRVGELEIDAADAFADEGPGVVELAFGQKSWRFGHVIVDEAQDLTPMEWRMVVRRARGHSMTIVGDLAQRTTGPPASWRELLPDALDTFDERRLTINYRSPSEVNDVATRVLAELASDLPPSIAIRSAGEEPDVVAVDDLAAELPGIVADELDALEVGQIAVIGHDLPELVHAKPGDHNRATVTTLDPLSSKGLEFDVVVLVEPARILDEPHGLGALYVALTRSTRRLRIVHERALPTILT
ncbi:MAG: hypothetical protein ACRBI6_02780 [Acidimicrobiales bacterium]